MTDHTPASIRVLLVDDQSLIRMGMRMVLEAQAGIEVAGEAADGWEAIAAVERLHPDVVLMDVRMPGLDGIAATRSIVAAHPASRILILTTFDLDEYAFAGLQAGASGFLLKDAQPAELVAAIRAVASGDAAVSPRVTRKLLELFGPQLPGGAPAGAITAVATQPVASAAPAGGTAALDPTAAARLASLTEREREVLVAIGEGLSNTEIATRLFLSESTVKTHVGRVLMKLELRDRVHAVIFAYSAGLAG
ncbi:response regulator transcription factor [Herbiconiux moechotypicola]|uniref:Response regulator n=1 Tax=Herbiconiux moechotypicola TaxID=637393 RepID=A0ABP5QZ28_9MICO|nr:response regulator transcription factor [Herbiconiux moechotypicola]MCS5731099.1 response regulator transcription factor [Herbiconiux moechotypicola]